MYVVKISLNKVIWPHTQHAQIHTRAKRYKCDVCGMGFHNKDHLITHKKTHTGETPYKCDVCTKFNQQAYLAKQGKGPTRCLMKKGQLTRHMRTHTTEKHYKYDICGNKDYQPSSLTKHMGSHTILDAEWHETDVKR